MIWWSVAGETSKYERVTLRRVDLRRRLVNIRRQDTGSNKAFERDAFERLKARGLAKSTQIVLRFTIKI